MNKNLLLAFAVFALASCRISGLTSGYSHLSKSEQGKVIHYKGKIADIHDLSNVYAVTPEQVKEYLATREKVVVYDYTPYCTAPNCVTPATLANICKKQKADLLIISNLYDDVFRAVNGKLPILMIETQAYKTKWRSKYIDAFFSSLIGRSIKDVDYAGYHYFKNGNYVRSFKDPNEIGKTAL
ncbi:hypothetical protein SAMN06298210_10224 [Prevotellaceae bacterium KH2P17]|nr:hypothetical protein SAMN06298210_10224 [Prevotellaceae bacterium KH2P17]